MRFYFWLFLFFPSFTNIQSEPTSADKKRDEILLTAEKFLGLKYKSKVSKNIFDCSGYVRFIMAGIGINITRSSVSQIHDGKRVKDVKNTRPGDILVFKGRNHRNNRPGHVGLAHHWSNDTLYFIHSSVSHGIRLDHLKDPYYSKRFLQVRDVIGD